MPELPEVETIRCQLSQKIIGKEINSRRVVGLRRRGKILIIDFDDGTSLIFHLKLTGQLIFNGKSSPYTRKIFNFKDGSCLIFNDARKFGWWKEVKETKTTEDKFGPEALEISFDDFKERLSQRLNVKIKPLLMNQKFIAGIGNIYSDEILFASKVHPLRRIKSLNKKEAENIFKNIKKILRKAIRYRGSSVKNYFDAYGSKGGYGKFHKIYQKEDQPCSRCKAIIQRLKISGRSAHFCPNCQPLC